MTRFFNSHRPGGRGIFPAVMAALISTVLFAALSGCSMLRGPESKTEILNKALKEFKNAMFWNSFDIVASFAQPENRATFVNDVKKAHSAERVVRIDVRAVDLTADENQADVDLVINYYKVPQYVVSRRVERYVWVYDGLRDAWFVKSLEVLPDDHEPVDVQGVLGVY